MDITYKTVGKLAERFGWDWCDEYGEPGYSLPYGAEPHAGIILGDYWCRCGKVREHYVDGRWIRLEDGEIAQGETRPGLHSLDVHYPRLFAAMGEQGWQLEWSDEWIIDWEGGNGKCYRTTGDSYAWQSSILWGDGYILTPDDEIDRWIDEVVNDPHRCLPSNVWSTGDLTEAGFVQWEPDDPHTYESGWHPGQTDDPETITREIRETMGDDVEIIFHLNGSGQFDVRFSAWTREVKS